MLIHLFRHGIAIDRMAPDCPADSKRFLTDKGKRRTKAAARGLLALGTEADVVLTSPFVRARQTAEIAAEELGIEAPLVETTALIWDRDPQDLASELASRDGDASILCVGHAPHLDRFIAHMVGTVAPVTELKKAGFATIYSDLSEPGDGVLLAVYPPRALRSLA